MSTADDFIAEVERHATEATNAAVASANVEELADVRRQLIGKSSAMMGLRRTLGSLASEDRRTAGATLNAALERVEAIYAARAAELAAVEPAIAEPLDVTLPSLPPLPPQTPSNLRGGLHPTIQLMYDLNDAFAALNFEVVTGPELSTEKFEFDVLNFPADHPARESMDTYWLEGMDDARGDDRVCLRPHLTGASVRHMLGNEPPFRFVYPGRVYRNETTDARHERSFFQYEVLIVDRDVSMTAGKFLVDTILDTVFGRPVRTRMRTGFFPFVEPGFEIDMECQVCGGTGCRTCHQVGWIELMPGGVPHPNVLRSAGLDPEEWNGFYVNVGLDRLTMMRYEVDDVRHMHSGDLRFLRQFS